MQDDCIVLHFGKKSKESPKLSRPNKQMTHFNNNLQQPNVIDNVLSTKTAISAV